jgi:hypothetical protein
VARVKNKRTRKDLEWFGPPERNALRPLFCITTIRAWSTKLEEANVSVCVA